jgi:hypothetical protein
MLVAKPRCAAVGRVRASAVNARRSAPMAFTNPSVTVGNAVA